ncbi:MAG TPA: ferritin-like domain-containing protein [Pyrinomonadaceae bacterium]|nr:ferritin-like domain-containing protein [Pyrinomonadaceae bacterium]
MPDERLAPEQLVSELEIIRDDTLAATRSGLYGRLTFGDKSKPPGARREVVAVLQMLLYPERRVPDVLARRFESIPDFDLKERTAHQIREEIEHAQLIQKMLEQWGMDGEKGWREPIPELVKIFDYIESLETLSEFFSTFLMGEGLFLSTYLDDMQRADPDAFSPYLAAALADEPGHIALARDALLRYASTPKIQARTRDSAQRLLAMFLGGYQARIREFNATLEVAPV